MKSLSNLLSNLPSNIAQKRDKANATVILFNAIASFRIEDERELNGPASAGRMWIKQFGRKEIAR